VVFIYGYQTKHERSQRKQSKCPRYCKVTTKR